MTLITNIPKPFHDASVTGVAELMKAGQIVLTKVVIENTDVTKAYLQIFDAAALTDITLGTTTPTFVLPLPASSLVIDDHENGLMFKKGVCYAVTTTPGGNTSPGAISVLSTTYSVE